MIQILANSNFGWIWRAFQRLLRKKINADPRWNTPYCHFRLSKAYAVLLINHINQTKYSRRASDSLLLTFIASFQNFQFRTPWTFAKSLPPVAPLTEWILRKQWRKTMVARVMKVWMTVTCLLERSPKLLESPRIRLYGSTCRSRNRKMVLTNSVASTATKPRWVSSCKPLFGPCIS